MFVSVCHSFLWRSLLKRHQYIVGSLSSDKLIYCQLLWIIVSLIHHFTTFIPYPKQTALDAFNTYLLHFLWYQVVVGTPGGMWTVWVSSRRCFWPFGPSLQVLDCPRLMDVVMSEFLPTSWSAPSLHPPSSVYGLPLAGALKLLRVLATSGRHACARLVSNAVKKSISLRSYLVFCIFGGH